MPVVKTFFTHFLSLKALSASGTLISSFAKHSLTLVPYAQFGNGDGTDSLNIPTYLLISSVITLLASREAGTKDLVTNSQSTAEYHLLKRPFTSGLLLLVVCLFKSVQTHTK